MSVRTKLKTQLLQLVLLTRHGLSSCFQGMLLLSFNNLTRHSLTSCLPGLLFVSVRAGKNLRFFKKRFRFLGFLGFNVAYAQSHAIHWTQEYDEEGLYTETN